MVWVDCNGMYTTNGRERERERVKNVYVCVYARMYDGASSSIRLVGYCAINRFGNVYPKGQTIFTHPTVTSNMLLPTELETAISPNPFLATITDVIRSGMEVPAAKNVRPIT